MRSPLHLSLLPAAILAVVTLAPTLATAKPKAAAPPAPKATVKAAPKATAKAKPQQAPAAKLQRDTRLEVQGTAAPIPAAGPLKFEHLVIAAMHNNLEIAQRRGEVEIAVWAAQAAKDFEDPELRLGWGTQTDIGVDAPYRESGRSTGSFSGSSYGRSQESGTLFSRAEQETGNFTERRFRRWEREVIPGATSTKIVETEYEERDTNGVGTKHRRGQEGLTSENRSTKFSESSGRRVIGRTITERQHPNVTDPDEDFSMLLRFSIPNPWERKAKIKAAEAAVDAAEWELQAEMLKVTMDVRALYERLSYQAAESRAQKALADQRYQMTSAPGSKTAKAGADAVDADFESVEAQMKAEELRGELAALTGILDVSRILVPEKLPLRRVDVKAIDKPYLLDLAGRLNPISKVLYHKFREAREKANEEGAKRIPFLTFADVGWEHRNAASGADQSGYNLRVGISIPLMSLFKNRSIDAARAEARSYSRQIGSQQVTTEARIDSALRRLTLAEESLKKVQQTHKIGQIILEKALGGALATNDPLEILNDTKEFNLAMEAQKLRFVALYNEAVASLEAAVGTTLDRILERRSTTGK